MTKREVVFLCGGNVSDQVLFKKKSIKLIFKSICYK